MDPNYDYHDDFFGDEYAPPEERMSDFLKMVFGEETETNPSVLRNEGCRFTTDVFEYLYQEWEVEITDCLHKIQDRAVEMVDACQKNGENVPNTAAKIAMEVLPL